MSTFGLHPFGAAPFGSAGAAPANEVMLSEQIAVSAIASADPIHVLRERVRMSDSAAATAQVIAALAEQVDCNDAVGVAWLALLSDTLIVSDTAAALRQQLATLTEVLIASGLADSVRQAHADILESVVMLDLLFRGIDADAVESVAVGDEVASTVRRLGLLFEQVQIEDAATPGVMLVVVCEEAVTIADAATASAQLFADLHEGLVIYASIRLGGEDYRCWVLSMSPTDDGPRAAVVEYQNFPFDTYEEFDGKWWGANEHGLFELDVGTTDDGAEIDAWIRSGLSNLGTGKAKRMPSLYLGYRSSGGLVLKAITTSETGEKVEDWYELTPRPAGAMREGRIKLGRGLKSVFWGFELHSQAGADFALDVVEWMPLVLDRRIS